jgi:putative aminopeptidase FrvX
MIEFGVARDYPCQWADRHDQSVALGKGPTLFIYDRGMLPDTHLLESVYTIADEHNIPVQWEYEEHYGQDAAKLQKRGTGVVSINIGIPVRYAHSHYGMMDKNDYDNTVALLYQSIKRIDKNFNS